MRVYYPIGARFRRINVADVRRARACDIRIPGESHRSTPGLILDGWLDIEYSIRDASGNVYWRHVFGPASQKALEEAYRMRRELALRDPITRQEKRDGIRRMLWRGATERDAEAVLDALEARGYVVGRAVDSCGGIVIIPPIREEEFKRIESEVIRSLYGH